MGKKIGTKLLVLLVSILLVVSGCGSKPTQTTDNNNQSDSLVSAAKAEGEVVIYAGGHTLEGIESLAKAFEDKYGIKVSYTRKGTGEVVKMISAELDAKALRADMISVADPGVVMNMAQKGVLEAYKVPNWNDIKADFKDPDGYWVSYSLSLLGIGYNTDKVKEADLPKSWDALADAKWNGRIVHASPTYSGTAAAFAKGITQENSGFYNQLANNKPIIVQSSLAIPQMLLTGEADLGIPAIESDVLNAKNNGEPLLVYYPGNVAIANLAPLALMKGAKHPNSAKLFELFHLSQEGQQLLADKGGRTALDGFTPPAGMPKLDELKLVVPDFAWLMKNRNEQNSQIEQILGKPKK